jgi:hypothetical protein
MFYILHCIIYRYDHVFICDIYSCIFKYVYEYEIMLPFDLHALNENEFRKKIIFFKRMRFGRKSVVLKNEFVNM